MLRCLTVAGFAQDFGTPAFWGVAAQTGLQRNMVPLRARDSPLDAR